MRFDQLSVGDTFTYRGTTVEVLREHEPCTDIFGRTMSRFWAKRHDTGAEGWIMYGPGGGYAETE